MTPDQKKHLLSVMDELMSDLRSIASSDNEPQLIRAAGRVTEAADIVDQMEVV